MNHGVEEVDAQRITLPNTSTQPYGAADVRANSQGSYGVAIKLADVPSERRWYSQTNSSHQDGLVRDRVKCLFHIHKGHIKWPQVILMVFDNCLDETNSVSYAIASTKRFLAGTEWKMDFHLLCKDPITHGNGWSIIVLALLAMAQR